MTHFENCTHIVKLACCIILFCQIIEGGLKVPGHLHRLLNTALSLGRNRTQKTTRGPTRICVQTGEKWLKNARIKKKTVGKVYILTLYKSARVKISSLFQSLQGPRPLNIQPYRIGDAVSRQIRAHACGTRINRNVIIMIFTSRRVR